MRCRKIFLPFLLFFIFPIACANAWNGKVVGVSDGDTIKVLHDGKMEKIRLYGIDAPEKGQDFGQRATEFISSLVAGKIVDVEPIDTDRYGRTVAFVRADNKLINQELVGTGMAWVYPQYCKHQQCEELIKLETQARTGKIGLWDDKFPIAPWDWRHSSGNTDKNNPALAQSSSQFHGNISSKIFHQPGCRYYGCKNCTDVFSSRDAAIKAGYRPCKICNP